MRLTYERSLGHMVKLSLLTFHSTNNSKQTAVPPTYYSITPQAQRLPLLTCTKPSLTASLSMSASSFRAELSLGPHHLLVLAEALHHAADLSLPEVLLRVDTTARNQEEVDMVGPDEVQMTTTTPLHHHVLAIPDLHLRLVADVDPTPIPDHVLDHRHVEEVLQSEARLVDDGGHPATAVIAAEAAVGVGQGAGHTVAIGTWPDDNEEVFPR
jgi:hypothetical protein